MLIKAVGAGAASLTDLPVIIYAASRGERKPEGTRVQQLALQAADLYKAAL